MKHKGSLFRCDICKQLRSRKIFSEYYEENKFGEMKVVWVCSICLKTLGDFPEDPTEEPAEEE